MVWPTVTQPMSKSFPSMKKERGKKSSPGPTVTQPMSKSFPSMKKERGKKSSPGLNN